MTPYPWEAIYDDDVEPGLLQKGWIIRGADGEFIALVADGSHTGLENMQVIKMAPQLLKASKKVVSRFEDGPRRAEDIELTKVVAFAEGID